MIVIAKLALIGDEAKTALYGLKFLEDEYDKIGNPEYARRFGKICKKIERAVEVSNMRNDKKISQGGLKESAASRTIKPGKNKSKGLKKSDNKTEKSKI